MTRTFNERMWRSICNSEHLRFHCCSKGRDPQTTRRAIRHPVSRSVAQNEPIAGFPARLEGLKRRQSFYIRSAEPV